MVTGTPIKAGSNMVSSRMNGLSGPDFFIASRTIPPITRLVAVPIKVHVPPRMDA